MISTTIRASEHIYHRQPGGGGWGDPLQREPAAVARDVRHDKVSLAAARIAYGVVLDEATLTVDEAATTVLRQQMAGNGDSESPASPKG
jgi:N-methylhydantoinase B